MPQMEVADYNGSLPYRIKNIYTQCSEKEQYFLKKILEELSDTGDSQTYKDIWLSDYTEIPVDIMTFISDDMYLGKATRNGTAVYPFWKQEMKRIFGSNSEKSEVILTGATRIGKTSTAVTCAAYMLYKMMCLKSPQAYFGKKDVSIFSLIFVNVTLDLARSVAYREFNDTLKSSPWFMDRGHMSRSETNSVYIPDGGKISIDVGSSGSSALGKQIFCLVGDTKIETPTGIKTLEEAANTTQQVLQYDEETNTTYYVDAQIVKTAEVKHTIRITLEDGSVLEGTPEHKVMLIDGTYKQLGELTEDDELFTL